MSSRVSPLSPINDKNPSFISINCSDKKGVRGEERERERGGERSEGGVRGEERERERGGEKREGGRERKRRKKAALF